MAITITNANANINDTTLTYALSFTGKTGYKVLAWIIVNGTTIGSTTSTGASPISVTFTAANLYSAAQGSSLTGAVTFRVTDLTLDDVVVGSSQKTGGTITINARITGLTMTKPTATNKWNMDSSTGNNLTASWTRPHAAFYARLKGYVNGTQIFSRYGFTNSTSFDVVALGYQTAIINAMGGVTPADFRLDVITQFDDGTGDYVDLSYTGVEGTNRRSTADSITKTFVTLSTINLTNSTFELTTGTGNQTVAYSIQAYGTYNNYINFYANGVKIFTNDILVSSTGTGTINGNFTLTSAEKSNILNAMPTSTSATTYAVITTKSTDNLTTYGTADSQGTSTTVTLNSQYAPALGTISWEENENYLKPALYGVSQVITNFIGNGTTTVTGTVSSTSGFTTKDVITITGAVGTEQSKLNGSWKIVSINSTTFTFVISSALASGTYTTNIGSTVRSVEANKIFITKKSKINFTIPVINATGASTASIRLQFAGTDQTSATSPVTTAFLITPSTDSEYTITVTDSRGRVTTTTSTTANIVVRDYNYPVITTFDTYRVDATTEAVDPLGTNMKYKLVSSVSDIKALDGTTQKNALKYLVSYSVKDTGNYTDIGTETTAAGITVSSDSPKINIISFLVANAYDFKILVRDSFYNNTSDYATQYDILPFGKVAMTMGPDYVSVGKLWAQGTLDVGGDIYSSGSLRSTVSTGTAPLFVNSTTKVTNLNADLLDGYSVDTAATANTVVARQANGYIYATYYNSNRADETSAAASYIYDTGDGWMRKKSLANAKQELGGIVDSGSGTGHTWTKFADGTLIKRGTIAFTTAISTTWGSLFTNSTAQTLTYDTTVAFTGNPNITFTPKSRTVNYLVWVTPYNGITTNTQWWLVSAISRTSQTYDIEWTAIGRWQ